MVPALRPLLHWLLVLGLLVQTLPSAWAMPCAHPAEATVSEADALHAHHGHATTEHSASASQASLPAPCDCGCDCSHPCAPTSAKLIPSVLLLAPWQSHAASSRTWVAPPVADPSPQRLLRPPILG